MKINSKSQKIVIGVLRLPELSNGSVTTQKPTPLSLRDRLEQLVCVLFGEIIWWRHRVDLTCENTIGNRQGGYNAHKDDLQVSKSGFDVHISKRGGCPRRQDFCF
jgi:hypothetical protein